MPDKGAFKRLFSVCMTMTFLSVFALVGARAQQTAVPVQVVRTDAGYRLMRDGKPYLVKGAGGDASLQMLRQVGGNSIRTWGADRAGKTLDEAQRLGVTVCVGLWLGHKEHGFHYDDPAQVAKQREEVRRYVEQYRNHHALLLWGIGNEMEGDGNDSAVWRAVEEIARMIKQIDPNHPTMTVIAEIGGNGSKAKQVAALCPDIDILGVNSYGGAASLPQRLKAAGWTRPYIVTEFGPNGPWEVGRAPWGAPQEASSTAKARQYAERYAAAVTDQAGWCLGSYAFTWGSKVEATPTWFGLFLPGTGERLGGVDALQEAWTGHAPEYPVPALTALESPAAGQIVAPGSAQSVAVRVTGSGPLNVAYEIRSEQEDHGNHEPGQRAGNAMNGIAPPAGAYTGPSSQSFTAPAKPGAYRLFVYVRDTHGGAVTANFPFKVQ